MILQNEIKIKIVPATINYWKSKGYDVFINKEITIKTKDLPEKSNYNILCQCENCLMKYYQRFSRNKEKCGSCILSESSKGNTRGRSNIKHLTPPKKELIGLLEFGASKSKIAEMYGVNVGIINRWFKENDIKLTPYHGRKYFKTEQEELVISQQIQDLVNKKNNISEIVRKLGIPRQIINMLKKKNSIFIESKFDKWKTEYNKIIENLDLYVKLNEKISLKEISINYNISIEHLKRAFSENEIEVKLHSYNKSKGELECRNFVKSLGVDCYSANINKKYEIDCYVKNKSFGIEYCGEYWHRYQPEKNNKNYHKHKFAYCKKHNINLMTIFECEWKYKRNILESMIKSRLGLNSRIYARNCEIKEINSNEANMFHVKHHINGKLNCSINIGLYFKNELVTVISFIKSRFDKNYQYEIGRYSSKFDTVVVGGLSKMFKHFVKIYNPESCMTYADLRFGEGKSYTKIGFELVGQTVPNYFYFNKNDGVELESRFKYQKSKLKKSKNTEFEIMDSLGYYRIYDCGNNKFVWKNI